MMRTLLWLEWHSRLNNLRTRLVRLRQPRYLFGAIAGAAYVWFFFGRPMFHRGGSGNVAFRMFDPTWFSDFGPLLLLAYVTLQWFASGARAVVNVTETEVAWFFAAPIPRRTLLQFKLLQGQFATVTTALVLTLLGGAAGGAFSLVTHFVGWWGAWTFLKLHSQAGDFTRERLAGRGLPVVRRRLAVTLLIVAVIGLTWVRTRAQFPELAVSLESPRTLLNFVRAMLTVPPLAWALQPCRWVLAPFAADAPLAWLKSLLPMLAMLVLHYFWMMRSLVPFEEASVAAAEKRTALIAAVRAGRTLTFTTKRKARGAPFPLAPTGRPELAIWWQRWIATGTWSYPKSLAALALTPAAVALVLNGIPELRPALAVAAAISAGAAAYALILGPALARRGWADLFSRLDVVRALPLRGWQIIAGELLQPIALMTMFQFATLTLAAVIAPTIEGRLHGHYATVWAGWFVFLLVLPPLVGLMFGSQLGFILALPAWFQPSPGTAAGIEVAGQRLIGFFGFILVFLCALLPAAAVCLPIALLLKLGVALPIVILLCGVAAFAVIAGEFVLLIRLLGHRLEKIDIANDLPR